MFFKKDKDSNENDDLIKVAALLIHAAKIDENYSTHEKEIIKQTLLKIGANDKNIEKIMNHGNEIEQSSNQILDFTKEVKNMNNENKILIIETSKIIKCENLNNKNMTEVIHSNFYN